jgi:integrase
MNNEKLPRGVHRRGDSLAVWFALKDTRCVNGHVPDCECGQIERRSVGECTVSYAENMLRVFKAQVRDGVYQKRQPRPEPTPKARPVIVSDLLEPYLRNYRNKGKRAESRQLIAWDHLRETFADVPVEKLETDRIEKYIESRRTGITKEKALLSRNATVNRELSLLRAMLTHGTKVTPRRVERMPAFPDKLEEGEARQGFIEDSQYRTLAGNAKILWLRTLLACAYHFGFRKNELLKLRVKQVDLFDRAINLERRQTKGNTARRIFLTDETFQLLAACISGKKENDFVFTRENGERVCDPREEWAALCVSSGLGQWITAKRADGEEFKAYRGLNLHDLRRSAVRRMVRSGISETIAMKISGHSTRKIFDTYDISSDADKREAARKIASGPKPETGRQQNPDPETGTGTDTKTDTAAFGDTYAHS